MGNSNPVLLKRDVVSVGDSTDSVSRNISGSFFNESGVAPISV